MLVGVADTDANGFQPVQYIQLGQAQPANRIDTHRRAQRNRIEPAATTRATSSCPELMAATGEALADVIKQLGRERAGPYSRCISFGNTQNIIEVQGTKTRTGGGTACGGIGAGHKRVGAVVNIEQGALGTLEHDVGLRETVVV